MTHRRTTLHSVTFTLLALAAPGCAPGGGDPSTQDMQPVVVCRVGGSAAERALLLSPLFACVPVPALHCPPVTGGGANADDCAPRIEQIERPLPRVEVTPEIVSGPRFEATLPWHRGPQFCAVEVDGCGPFYLRPEEFGRGLTLGAIGSGDVAAEQRPEWVENLRESLRWRGPALPAGALSR